MSTLDWPSADETALAGSVRSLLEDLCDSTAIRSTSTTSPGMHAPTWRALVDHVGVPGLAVPEDVGGAGGDVGALAAVAVEVGRRAAPLPWLSVALAAEVLVAGGAEKELAHLLAGAPVALALGLDARSTDSLDVAADGTLTGEVAHLVDAIGAQLLLVRAGSRLFLVEADAAGLDLTQLQTLDLTRSQARARFDAVPARELHVTDLAALVDRLRDLAAVLVAAEQLGGARWCLDTATAYAKVRQQFGAPIGSFQAVKHLLADLLVETELAECLLRDAVSALRPGSQQSARATSAAVAAAAAACTTVGVPASAGALQVLGGIGFTWEHDVHLYYRRARASASLAGSPTLHRERLAEQLVTTGNVRTRRPAASAELAAFTKRAASWLADHAPLQVELIGGDPEQEAQHVARGRAFQAGLHEAGLAGISWPEEHGGLGLSADHELAFTDAARGRHVYTDMFGIGLGMCAPVLIALGTPEQQAALPAMLRGEQLWCQLFSEPDAGSDIASLRTRAELQDDGSWIVTGDKVWTTYAHQSDFGLLLARTDAGSSRHHGLSMFVLDMSAPGVTASPLRQITGDSEFNEVHLDGVRLPVSAVVGEVGGGWKAALIMLMHERVTLGRNPLAMSSPVHADRARELVRERGLGADPVLRQRLSDVWVLQRSLELLGDTIASGIRAGHDPGPFASIAKLGASLLAPRTASFAAEVAGADAAAWDPSAGTDGLWAHGLLHAPAMAIAGGTDQIQRSIIGERLLGLPR